MSGVSTATPTRGRLLRGLLAPRADLRVRRPLGRERRGLRPLRQPRPHPAEAAPAAPTPPDPRRQRQYHGRAIRCTPFSDDRQAINNTQDQARHLSASTVSW